MFSIEFDADHTCSTILDNDGRKEDVQLLIGDDEVYMRQWNEKRNKYEVINFSPMMFKELMTSMDYPEGLYATSRELVTQ